MNVYSHLVIAVRMEGKLRPTDREAYAWGAVAADVRYPAGLRRQQTHLPWADVRALRARRPELRDFLLGYAVHILCDDIDPAAALRWWSPARLGRGLLPRQAAPVLLELGLIRRERLEVRVQEQSNAVLEEMGAPEETVIRYAQAVNRYLAAPGLEGALEAAGDLGLSRQGGAMKYLGAAREFERRPWLLRGLLASLDLEGFVGRACRYVEKGIGNNR